MMFIFWTLISTMALSTFLFFFSTLISKKSKNLREKQTPFECGFDFMSHSRMPFSLKFFLIAIIFIIFDVEIALIIPLIPTIQKSMLSKWMVTSLTFLVILILGVFLEWKEKSFEWKI